MPISRENLEQEIMEIKEINKNSDRLKHQMWSNVWLNYSRLSASRLSAKSISQLQDKSFRFQLINYFFILPNRSH